MRFMREINTSANAATAPSRNPGAPTLPTMRDIWSMDGTSDKLPILANANGADSITIDRVDQMAAMRWRCEHVSSPKPDFATA